VSREQSGNSKINRRSGVIRLVHDWLFQLPHITSGGAWRRLGGHGFGEVFSLIDPSECVAKFSAEKTSLFSKHKC